jgi:hypothetical protein
MVIAAAGFFATLYAAVSYSDPVGSNPVATRGSVIPSSTMQQVIGAAVTDADEEE